MEIPVKNVLRNEENWMKAWSLKCYRAVDDGSSHLLHIPHALLFIKYDLNLLYRSACDWKDVCCFLIPQSPISVEGCKDRYHSLPRNSSWNRQLFLRIRRESLVVSNVFCKFSLRAMMVGGWQRNCRKYHCSEVCESSRARNLPADKIFFHSFNHAHFTIESSRNHLAT
jgi:hypothetical protein